MTQPNDITMTFDTSLIDLRAITSRNPSNADSLYDSFSTTETAPSDWATKAIEAESASQQTAKPIPPSHSLSDSFSRILSTSEDQMSTSPPNPTASNEATSGMPVHYLPTVDAYDAWASVYDTDGNMLQAVDDDELLRILPDFLAMAQTAHSGSDADASLRIVDFGCGTGRNTARVLGHTWPEGCRVEVVGVDASRGMLERAKEKLGTFVARENISGIAAVVTTATTSGSRVDEEQQPPPVDASTTVAMVPVSLQLLQHDFLVSPTPPPQLQSPLADAVVSTLVLEHFPLDAFFEALVGLLRPGGLALVTNMHSDMGKISQAGFIADGTAVPLNTASSSTDDYDMVGERQGGGVGGASDGRMKIRGESWAHGVQETVVAAQAAGFKVVGEVGEREVTEEMLGTGVVGERGRKWVGKRVWYGMILRKID